jgi:hypothetical protein
VCLALNTDIFPACETFDLIFGTRCWQRGVEAQAGG